MRVATCAPRLEADLMDTPLSGKIHWLGVLASPRVKPLRPFKNEAGALNISRYISGNLLTRCYRMGNMELLRVVIFVPCLPKSASNRSRQSHGRSIIACQCGILAQTTMKVGNGSAEKSGSRGRMEIAIMMAIERCADANHRFITDDRRVQRLFQIRFVL